MKIEINAEVADRLDLNEAEILAILAVALYKMEKINGVQGGKIIGKSEIEFHGLLGKYNQFINYDEIDLENDLNNLKNF